MKGGKNAKRVGNKFVVSNNNHSSVLRLPVSPMEIFVMVTKANGNSMFDVISYDGEVLNCVLRQKFKGKRKHQSFVSPGNVVLVGLREWEVNNNANKNKKRICDLLEVYSLEEITRLKTLPIYKINELFKFKPTNFENKQTQEDFIEFTHDATTTTLIIEKENATSFEEVVLNKDNNKENDDAIDIDDI